MNNPKYSFLNGIPIDPDPEMPPGKKRWEIVPACEVETRDMEYTLDGLVWHPNYHAKSRGVASWSAVLAFRRPTALKEAGAGSLGDDSSNPICKACGSFFQLRESAESTGYCDPCAQDQLTTLRTLAKEQSEALREISSKIRKAMNDVQPPELGSEMKTACWNQGRYSVICAVLETLTLIAKLKEVGE